MVEPQSSSSSSTRRINGWEFPPHPLQVVTWILFPLIIIQYYLFLMPLLWNLISQIILSILYGFVLLFAAYTGYMTCHIDPCDNALEKNINPSSIANNDLYCYLCEVNV